MVIRIQQTPSTPPHPRFTSLDPTRLSDLCTCISVSGVYVMEGFYLLSTLPSHQLSICLSTCLSICSSLQLSSSSCLAIRLLGAASENHHLQLRQVQPLRGHRHCSEILLYFQFVFLHLISSLSTSSNLRSFLT